VCLNKHYLYKSIMQQLVELQLWGACDWNDEAYEGPWEEEGS